MSYSTGSGHQVVAAVASGRGMDPSGLPGRLLSIALVLLLAAWALSAAVHLLTSIWIPLAVIAGVSAVTVAAVAWYRNRPNGW